MAVEKFPQDKSLEKFLRSLDKEGEELVVLANKIKLMIDSWEDRYIEAGTEYIKAGGKDPDLLNKIWAVTKAREIFGSFL